MKKYKKILYSIIGLFLIVGIWEIIALSTGQQFLPEFFTCFGKMILLFGKKRTWLSLGSTFLKLIISLAISSIFGIIMGLLAGYFDFLRKIFAPLITVLKAFPTVALVLLLVVFVKYFYIYVVAIVCFPIIYQAALEGSDASFKRFAMDLRLNGNAWYNMTRVVLPLSTPYYAMGFLQAFALGLKVQVMAEILSYQAGDYGLGNLIYSGYTNVEYHNMMAYVLMAIIVALIVDALLYLLSKYVKEKVQ